MIIVKEKNKIIKNYKNKLASIESKYNIIQESNINELKEFVIKFNQYKFTFGILFSDKNFYEELRFIELPNDNNYNYQMEIWNNEHYFFMEDIRSIESDIKLLLKFACKNGIISAIQYELMKNIKPKIKNIFESEVILSSLYEHKNNFISISREESDFYFNIIEIIILNLQENKKKIRLNKNNDFNNSKINKLLFNKDYIDTIANIKNTLLKI